MKSDLDRLMEERNLDAFMVLGDSGNNPAMNYLTGGIHLEHAIVLKRRGGLLTLVHGSLERTGAATTGLELVDRDRVYNQYDLLNKHQGDRLNAMLDYYSQVIRDQQLTGRLGVYGKIDAGGAYQLLNRLQAAMPDVEIVGEYADSIFAVARETKDDAEIAELLTAGRETCAVVGEVQEFIQGHGVRGKTVVRADGEPLTIGDVKAFIRMRLMAHGLVEDHDTLFSLGGDSALPHASSNLAQPLELGRAIVLDIFPRTAKGYFADMTRTWSLGYATDDVQEIYDQVREIFDRVMGSLELGKSCRDYQLMTLDYFEERGHPTLRSHPGTRDGYFHSLGHGIGLDVHEGPRLSHGAGADTPLQPGHVFSVEPGLYYQERDLGMRIEDSVAFTESGELVNLNVYPYDLVLPMHG